MKLGLISMQTLLEIQTPMAFKSFIWLRPCVNPEPLSIPQVLRSIDRFSWDKKTTL